MPAPEDDYSRPPRYVRRLPEPGAPQLSADLLGPDRTPPLPVRDPNATGPRQLARFLRGDIE